MLEAKLYYTDAATRCQPTATM